MAPRMVWVRNAGVRCRSARCSRQCRVWEHRDGVQNGAGNDDGVCDDDDDEICDDDDDGVCDDDDNRVCDDDSDGLW